MMHLFVICGVIFAAVLQVEGVTDTLAPSREKCTTQLSLTAERIAEAETNPLSQDFSTFKCFVRCVLNDIEVLNADGKVNVEAATAAIVENAVRERLRPKVAKCVSDTELGEDGCKYAYLVTKCLQESDPQAYASLGITATPKEI